jgi:hypothetical protein
MELPSSAARSFKELIVQVIFARFLTTKTQGTTECSDGNCVTTNTVTVTTRDSSGVVIGTSTSSNTSQESHSSFCQENGKSVQCGGNVNVAGSFSGDCQSGFVASGEDPILNAMAQEQYVQNCKMNPDDVSQQYAKNEAQKDGTNVTGTNPNNSSVGIGANNFDTSDALGLSRACPADRAIPIFGGKSLMLPWSDLCGSLEALGSVLVAVSLLLAGRIVTRG